MKQIAFYLTFCLLVVGCDNSVGPKDNDSEHPQAFIGSWINDDSTDILSEAILILNNNGSYKYFYKEISDSTSYLDAGSWAIKNPDNDTSDSVGKLRFCISSKTHSCCSIFKLTTTDGKDSLSLQVNEDLPMTIFQRKKN
jgi:hypothetical protein